MLSHNAAVLFALFSLSLFSSPASAAEEIRLAADGPLSECVLSFALPAGYTVKEVERRYDKYWYIDVTGPPTIETSRTQKYQDPQTYESVPDTMSISISIGTISMSQPNMTAIADYHKLAITEVYEEGDTQIDGHDAHYVLASHTSEPTGYFTSFLQSGSIAVRLGAAWYVAVGSDFLGDRLDVETEDFVLKVKVGDTPIIEKHQQNLIEVLRSVKVMGHAMGVSLEPPESPEGWELVGHYYDVNNVEIEHWGLGMATAPGKDPPDLLHIPRVAYVKWNGMSSDEFVKWVYRPIDPLAAQLQVCGESPFYIAMTDGQNRTTGWLAKENQVVNEIPGAVCVGINQTWDHPYESEPAQQIRILEPSDHYTIDLIGTGEGRYKVTITGLVGSNITSTDRITGTIAKDAMIRKDVYTRTDNGDLVVSFPELSPITAILCCVVTAVMMGHRHRSAATDS